MKEFLKSVFWSSVIVGVVACSLGVLLGIVALSLMYPLVGLINLCAVLFGILTFCVHMARMENNDTNW